MPRIRVIEKSEATGRLKEIYDELIVKRGKLAEVHTIQSLRPESIVKHIDLYLEIMFSKSELSRSEREMMAVVVSKTNGCVYCQKHHTEALNNYWKDEGKTENFRISYHNIQLNEKELTLCRFAEQLTKNPESAEKNDITEDLKNVGLSDSAILDATLVIAYFNFVNRIVLALGVELEKDLGTGYKY
ncbi:MAG: peroxidase [Bacteroidetes bacterium CG18_big_fil_WC_8_21_14_2_50_41_14]|nr:MAG: peroxidase [Bacteroidetes bacterium CG18_big_fil_WC_8_21_14_2_50_41_14]